MAMAKVTPEQARNSLLAFKRQNYEVDPDNIEHQDKYREMRLKFARVSPAQFVKFLDTGKEIVSAGTSSAVAYWAVPKTNFPKGLPPKIKACEVSADDATAPKEIDRNEYFVIDQCIPREQFGKSVFTVTSYTSTVNKYQSAGPSRVGGQPRALGEAREERAPMAAATGAEQSAVVARRPSNRRLREHISSGGSDEPMEAPAMKKAKLLTDTLATLKTNIEKAKETGVWVSQPS